MRRAGERLYETMVRRLTVRRPSAFLNNSANTDASLHRLCRLLAFGLWAPPRAADRAVGRDDGTLRQKTENARTEIGGTHPNPRNGVGPRQRWYGGALSQRSIYRQSLVVIEPNRVIAAARGIALDGYP